MTNQPPATLTLGNGESIPLETQTGTFGDSLLSIAELGKKGIYTFDPGFKATAACESKITSINGAAGELRHRGYPIDQLADKNDFMDVCHLLLKGELPNAEQKFSFESQINAHRSVSDMIGQTLNAYQNDAHPMAMLMGMTSALAGEYHHKTDLNNPEERELAAIRMIAKVPTIAAMAYRHSQQLPLIAPDENLGYAANFLTMMFGDDPKALSPKLIDAMDEIFILHADHEQNASTSTVRLAGSTGADPFACMASGIAALWGKAHGGANEACLDMLETIGSIDNIDDYIKKAKDSNDPFRLMGFGHRVYKSYDPRATIMRGTCHEVLKAAGASNEPLFKLAMALEAIALEDDYFVSRNLYPNVDFYSGLTQSALGIPNAMFTVIFALARTSGWAAHWLEMHANGLLLGRPRQLYTGPDRRDVK